MIPKRHLLAFVLSLVALISAAPAQSGPRPYAAHLLTTTTSATPVGTTQLLLTYVATGTGTHVGSYQESGSYLVDLTNFTFVGSATATAADGSTFSFTISGGFTGPTTLAGTTVDHRWHGPLSRGDGCVGVHRRPDVADQHRGGDLRLDPVLGRQAGEDGPSPRVTGHLCRRDALASQNVDSRMCNASVMPKPLPPGQGSRKTHCA